MWTRVWLNLTEQEQFRQRVEQIAACLPGEWEVDHWAADAQTNMASTLGLRRQSDSARLNIQLGDRGGRVRVWGSITRRVKRSGPEEITISFDKTPERIGREIAQRYLPSYEIDLAASLAAQKEAEEVEALHRERTATLAALLPGSEVKGLGLIEVEVLGSLHGLTVTVDSDGDVSISCPYIRWDRAKPLMESLGSGLREARQTSRS